VPMDCGASSAPQIRTTLYFGLSRPKGSVSELEWQIFMRDEVTRRFPDGLTSVAGGHTGVPQGVRSAIGTVGKRAGLRRGVGANVMWRGSARVEDPRRRAPRRADVRTPPFDR
jgi:hypothetical protein